jgi:hypothetical protein
LFGLSGADTVAIVVMAICVGVLVLMFHHER